MKKIYNVQDRPESIEYIEYRLSLYEGKEKNLETLFELMFSESNKIMIETSDGYRIDKVTYGEFKKKILDTAPTVAEAFADIPHGEMIGLHMANCPEWLILFWSIIISGYNPLVMNTRLSESVLNGILLEHNVKGVISDGKTFSTKTVMKEDALLVKGSAMSPRTFGTEVLFMSSGTTNNVKLCAYNGENFYYQVQDTANLVKTCPATREHYDGAMKNLMLLPLCHVFGFIAVYLWFGYFARCFVFPRDLSPATIQKTVKKHKVTHICAVPMVWDSTAKAAIGKIKARGDKTYNKFMKVTSLINSMGDKSGKFLARKLLSEVRDGLFGDSIVCLISGGSEISPSTLEFFNGIGYHLANGFGMTELGITSMEKSSSRKILNSGSIGDTFGYTEYSVGENGHLLVKGKTRATRILHQGKEIITNYDEWFDTGDMVRYENGRYYSEGRSDDLIIGDDGENLNPVLTEAALQIPGIDKLCVFADRNKSVALIVSLPGCFVKERLSEIYEAITAKIKENGLDRSIHNIYFTHESLLAPGEIKLSRKNMAGRIANGSISTFDPKSIDSHVEEIMEELERNIRLCFAEVLGKDPSTIGGNSHFFRDLNGTSIDYFALLGMIKSKLGFEIENKDSLNLSTVNEFAEYLKNK